MAGSFASMYRCGVPTISNYGAQAIKKCRNIDEMSESMLNTTAEDYETYSPKGNTHALPLARLLRHSFGASIELAGFTADFKAAFWQSLTFKACVRMSWLAYLTALAFGSWRAPAK